MPDRKTLKRIDNLGYEIDAVASAMRKIAKEIGSPEWLKLNNRLFNLIAKRDRLIEKMKEAAG